MMLTTQTDHNKKTHFDIIAKFILADFHLCIPGLTHSRPKNIHFNYFTIDRLY